MEYTIVRKFYKTEKDITSDEPYKMVDVWVGCGCEPLTFDELKIVLPKMMKNSLWINQPYSLEK